MLRVAALAASILLIVAPALAGPSPDQVRDGLAPDADWASHVQAARAATETPDAALIPALWSGFVASKRGTIKQDPDIHERLLIGLEQHSAATVVAALKSEHPPPEIADHVSIGDYHAWLDLLAADPRGFTALRVVQGDGLTVLIDGGEVVLPPPAAVSVPGGEADTTSALPSYAIDPDRLPLDPDGTGIATAVAVMVLCLLIVLAGRVPSTRRWVFPLFAIGLAPLGLLATEAGLAAVGVETLAAVRPNFHLGGEPPGTQWFVAPPSKPDRRVTNKNNARQQSFEVDFEGLRVVALGGSSVRGKGDLVEYAWPSVLERRLAACSPPKTPVHVVNAGADGALSDDLALVAANLLDVQPDVFVVYTGYNDFVFVPLLTRFEGFSPRQMGLRYALGRTRIAHLGARLSGRLKNSERTWTAVSKPSMVIDTQVADMRRLLADNLRWNLRRIARLGREHGIRVVFVTQGQNEDLCGSGALGGQREWDRTCFPIDARRTILEAASAENVPVVDAAVALRDDAGGNRVGWSHFWDEIHPGRRGSGVIGEAVARTVVDLEWGDAARCSGEALPAR